VLHSEVHFEGRIPIYAKADGLLGLPDIPLEEGLDNLHKFLTGDYNTQPPAETVSVETLIRELIEGGAVAISLVKNLVNVTGSPYLHFRAHMRPETGNEIAGQYQTVKVGDKNYAFVVEPVLDGPEFSKKFPIYTDEDLASLNPVPVELGIRNLKVHLDGRLEN